MRIIPAIDIIDGKCVRLTKGDYSQKKVYGDPLEAALEFEQHGIRFLHLVDLDGALNKKIVNLRTLETIATKTTLAIDFGGGVQSKTDIESLLNAGAKQVTIGSIAATNPELFLEWLSIFGNDKIILGADCKARLIATNAWTETSGIDVIDFLKTNERNGVKSSVVTDIAKDGMLLGPSLDLYREIIAETNIALIASGGISSIDDVSRLKDIGCDGAIIGKAIYEDRITLKQLRELC